ncbi:hypothetical protein JCM3774_004832 [Rhodotorula dairenensis]
MLGRVGACARCRHGFAARHSRQAGESGLAHSSRPLSVVSSGVSGWHDSVSASSGGSSSAATPVALSHPAAPPKAPRKRGRPARAPKPTLPQIRNILVDYLANGRNADAIAFYVDMLKQNRGDWTAETAEGFAWLFVQYRQADLARHAAAELHDHGFSISTALASKILRMHKDELVYEPAALASVLEWLSEGLGREKRAGTAVDEGMLETVLDVLKRMGRTDWLEQVFRAYTDTLEVGEVGSARLWSFLIGAKLLDGDVRMAEKHFDTWRTGYQASRFSAQTSPPSAPYLVLLAHYASRSYSGPASRDPAYRFLAVCRSDGVEVNTDYLDLLLRTELLRKQHSSFWGVWKAFDNPALGLVRSRATWLLAVRAKMRAHDLNRELRDSARRAASPLPRLLSFAYEPARAPSSRQLFRGLLRQRLVQTGHRPKRRLDNAKTDPFVSADVLNVFLEHFVAARDWQAATVVLETFRVHRVEPNFKTHGNIVLGVVKQWRRGKVRGTLDYTDSDAHDDTLRHAFDDPQLREAEERGFSSVRTQQQGLDLIRKILEQRKMRMGLWRRGHEGEGTGYGMPIVSGCDPSTPEGDELDHPAAVTSRWMAQRERRDLEYLVSLLRRCEGVDEEEWDRVMAKARIEILPERRLVPKLARSLQPSEAKRAFTKGVRHRAGVRAARLHLDG